MKIGNVTPALQVDGVQAASRARSMHGVAPKRAPKAVIPPALPKQVEGKQAGQKARTMNFMAPANIPDAVEQFTNNMEQMERLAVRGNSSATDLSI